MQFFTITKTLEIKFVLFKYLFEFSSLFSSQCCSMVTRQINTSHDFSTQDFTAQVLFFKYV